MRVLKKQLRQRILSTSLSQLYPFLVWYKAASTKRIIIAAWKLNFRREKLVRTLMLVCVDIFILIYIIEKQTSQVLIERWMVFISCGLTRTLVGVKKAFLIMRSRTVLRWNALEKKVKLRRQGMLLDAAENFSN